VEEGGGEDIGRRTKRRGSDGMSRGAGPQGAERRREPESSRRRPSQSELISSSSAEMKRTSTDDPPPPRDTRQVARVLDDAVGACGAISSSTWCIAPPDGFFTRFPQKGFSILFFGVKFPDPM